MQIYLFWSQMDAEVFGLALDHDGKSLPSDLGPWLKNGVGEAVYVCSDETAADAAASNSVIRVVQRDGFYLAKTGPTGRMSLKDQTRYIIADSGYSGNRRAASSIALKK
jgi:hypothetical protein